ncbi:MAG TPA: 30S ribosomal protein S4e [Methanomicrobiales archaeon]|nr:30S ribosomal protein S4e [Methanomicrobiales archaeon]
MAHLKRYAAPDSWHIRKKSTTYVAKTAPGPHDSGAMPVAVWLRDHMSLARTMREVRQILNSGSVIINGRVCKNPSLGIGVFDIVSVPGIGKHYRILLDRRGRYRSIEISPEDAKTRLAKIRGKTVISRGRVQLNLLFGANVIADNSYKPKDSVVLSLEEGEGKKRFAILDHFPYAVGNVAMVIGGRHSGSVGRILEIRKEVGAVPNRVILENTATKEKFDTIEEYVFMVGKAESAVKSWGIEE